MAKEFESYKHLPKYSHVSLAVIHPSPRKKKDKNPDKEPDFKISGH